MENCGQSALRGVLGRSFTLGEALGWWGVTLLTALIGAHFYRAYEYGLTMCAAGMILFHFSGSAWKRYAIGLFLFWGAFEWADTARLLATVRLQMGAPWLRGAGILLAAGALTALGGRYALKRGKRIRELESGCGIKTAPGGKTVAEPAFFKAVVFMATFLILFFIRQKSHTDLLLLERFFPTLGSVQIFFASWYAAFVAGKLINPRSSRKTRRRIWLLFALVFFAQFGLGLLGVPHMLMTGKLHVPIPAFIAYAPVFRGSFSMMPVMAAVVVLLAGSAWCSLLCYFGGFDSAAAGLARKTARPSSPGQERFMNMALKYGRPAVLLTGVLAALGLRLAGANLETAVATAIAFAVLSLGVMLFISRKYGRMAHCTAFCPFGLLVSLLSRLSPWRMRVNNNCNNCGACEKICLYQAITPESRAKGGVNSRCTLCRDCTGICTKKAVRLHSALLPERWAAPFFVGLITVLHVLFLNLARV